MAQSTIVTSDTTLDASGNPYSGIQVENGAELTGTDLNIEQSSNGTGVRISEGSADLTGGTIEQSGTGKYVVGVRADNGTASVRDMAITIDGGADAGGLYTSVPGASIVAENVTIDLTATGATGGEPAAALKGREGLITSTNGHYTVRGDIAYGILGNGGSGNGKVVSTGDTVETFGELGNGVFAYSAATGSGEVEFIGGSVTTHGDEAKGLYTYGPHALLTASDDATVTTHGDEAVGALARIDSQIDLTDVDITTWGEHAYGIQAETGGAVTGQNVDIVTNGIRGYGAYATASGGETASIDLTGGSITNANTKGQGTQDGDGSRAYAVFAEGDGARVTTDGTTIHTLGQRAYGAYSIDGGTVELTDGSIRTEGFMAYGVYASGAGSTVTTNNVDITTTGQVGDAAWAYAGGRTTLNGGTLRVLGEPNPNPSHETANGLVALGGTNGVNDGVIVANGVTIVTEGTDSRGVLAGDLVGSDQTSGTVELHDTSITVRGRNADIAHVKYGSTFIAQGSSLVSRHGVGVRMTDNATVSLSGTRIQTAGPTFVSDFTQSGQRQTVTVGKGSVATVNNGTLLQVNRETAGQDGQVQLTLKNGSTTRGDIVDTDPKSSGGYTDVLVEANADWTGNIFGVRNFVSQGGSDIEFDDDFVLNGNLAGNGSSYTFSQQGGTINGNVDLNNGSTTTGGSIRNRVIVNGNVGVDSTSTLGGNWRIGGDLDNAGTITPGNSIGVVSVGGDLTLSPSAVYNVEVDGQGRSDLIEVGGTASLAGRVAVTPLGGYLLDTPYTILTASSLGGTRFDSVIWNGNSVFVTPELSYGATNVALTLSRTDVAFASVANTRNQRSTARALDSLALDHAVIQPLAFLAPSDARKAFDSLSGEISASVQTTLIDDSRFVRNAALNRLQASFDETVTPDMPGMNYLGHAAPNGITAWGQGYGSWGSWDGSTNTASLDRSIGGFVVGLDGAVAPNTRLGILAGHANSSVDAGARFSNADIDTTNLGIYGGTRLNGFNLRGGLAYAWYGIDTDRTVAFPGYSESLSADYDADSLQAFGEAGYRIETMPANLEPFVGLAHINLDTDSFKESGGAAALQGSGASSDTTFTTVGLRASSDNLIQTMPLTARGMIGWRHAFGDTDPSMLFAFTGGSSAFEVVGVPLSEDALVLEAGLDLAVGSMTTVSVSYSGQMGEDSDDHGVQGDLTLRF
ncbi:MAG: autotransporter domain-containing protein [Methyloligella sp. ZOD6]